MKNNILINTNEVESSWEKPDACFVKMTSGKIWVCDKITNFDGKPVPTKDYILQNPHSIIRVYLLSNGGAGYGK